jgi:hypothetical protein
MFNVLDNVRFGKYGTDIPDLDLLWKLRFTVIVMTKES